MTFVKTLVICYLLTFLFGLFVSLFPFINPYFVINATFDMMIFTFYTLLTIDLFFTYITVYLMIKKDNFDLPRDKCFENNYFNFVCIFCDYYKECRKEKNNYE